MRRTDPDLPAGIRRTPTGFQAYRWKVDPSRPRGGYQTSKRFGADTPIATMVLWRHEQELRGKQPEKFAAPESPRAGFTDDAKVYVALPKVQRMPTRDQRIQHTEEWCAIFGNRERAGIEPQEIQQALDRMLARGKSPGSVNKRRTALMDLWTVLDGRHRANPVKATRPAQEPPPEPRAPELGAVLTLINGMRKDTAYAQQCRARVAVIAWTGWPHAILKQLEPADREHWKKGTAFVQRRKKGKGSRARWLPLLPEAVKALHEFHKADAYGWFSNSTLHKRVTKACETLTLPKIRPYDLRHFFGTLVATLVQDERALKELMLVTSDHIIRRYTDRATDPRVRAAVAAIVKQLPSLKRAAALAERGRMDTVSGRAGKGQRVGHAAKTLSKSRKVLVGASGFEPLTPAV